MPLFALPAHAETRVALVIGNSAYQHTRALPNPRNDADAVGKALRDIGFTVTVRHDQDYAGLRRAIREFGEAARGADIALIHFAGHGLELGGENYLVPVDARLARESDLEYEAVTLTSLLAAVRGASRLRLVILDACRNNPLSDKIALSTGATRSVTRGLARVEPSGDVLVAYSAKAGTVAEDGKGALSPYADALVRHIATPNLDVRIMFGRVRDSVLQQTRTQEPFIYGSVGGENIYLARSTAGPAPQRQDDLTALQTEVARLKAAMTAKQIAPAPGAPRDETAELKERIALLEAELKRRGANPGAETPESRPIWNRLWGTPAPSTDASRAPSAQAAQEWALLDKTSREELELFIRRHAGSPLIEYAEARRMVLACRDEDALQRKAVADKDAGVLRGLAANAVCSAVREQAGAQVCRDERTEIERLTTAKDRNGLRQLAAAAWCKEIQPLAGQRICESEEAEADQLAKNWNRDGLKRLAVSATCEGARSMAVAAERNLPPCNVIVPVSNAGTRCMKPGDVFRDCPECPEMVISPAGSATLGSPSVGQQRFNDEAPQRYVTITSPFAVGKFEVTFAEWDACVSDRGCTHRAADHHFGRGRLPVIEVSWIDAKGYVAWLARKTGHHYRLLTEDEWEFMARANGNASFPTGETITTEQANFYGQGPLGSAQFGAYRQRTVEVGSFRPNAFGVHDTVGNVLEWVEDCYQGSSRDTPSDKPVRGAANCAGRIVKGGSWADTLRSVRPDVRKGLPPESRGPLVGFRVARTLSP